MANTYEKIATFVAPGTDSGVITFSSIPATYTDLLLLCSLHTNSNTGSYGEQVNIRFNGSSSNFSSRRIEGYGTSISPSTEIHGGFAKVPNDNNSPGSNMGNAMIYIPSYTSNTNKAWFADSIMQINGANNELFIYANLWSNTAVINEITISSTEVSSRFRIGSSVTLYGIKKD